MSGALEIMGMIFVVLGTLFFTAGTVGLLRFPDVRNQLHALTKADNLGLGLLAIGAALLLGSWAAAGLLALTWVFALAAASVSARLLGELEAEDG